MNARYTWVCLLIQVAFATGCSEKHVPKTGVSNEMVMSPESDESERIRDRIRQAMQALHE